VPNSLGLGALTDLKLHFGSVQQTMLSLYVASLGGNDWAMYFDILEPVSSKVVFLMFIFFLQITILNILTGIYVDSALKCAHPDRLSRAKAVRMNSFEDSLDLRRMFRARGFGDSGAIDEEAFLSHFKDELFCAYLSTFGINSSDPETLFRCLKADGVPLTMQRLVEGLMKLKDPTTNYDIERVALRSGGTTGKDDSSVTV